MHLHERDIIGYFSPQVFNRGRNYHNAKLVKNLNVTEEAERVSLSSKVHGTEIYAVSLTVTKDSMMGACACPHFASGSALFELEKPDDLSFFGNQFQLYALSKEGLYCCSEPFTQKVYPLTTLRKDTLAFHQDELPTLCSVVLSELEGLYNSLLKRKKYHKLADGRYLPKDRTLKISPPWSLNR